MQGLTSLSFSSFEGLDTRDFEQLFLNMRTLEFLSLDRVRLPHLSFFALAPSSLQSLVFSDCTLSGPNVGNGELIPVWELLPSIALAPSLTSLKVSAYWRDSIAWNIARRKYSGSGEADVHSMQENEEHRENQHAFDEQFDRTRFRTLCCNRVANAR